MRRVALTCLATFAVVGTTAILPGYRLNAQVTPKEEQKLESQEAGQRGLLLKKLRLYPPVNAFGPYPYQLYTANVGDLVQLQVSYPTSPPFPSSIAVGYYPSYFTVIDIVETDGEVVIVPPPAQGGVGVGHYSIFLKPIRNGRTHVDVVVRFENGDVAEVPFNFLIGGARKLMEQKK